MSRQCNTNWHVHFVQKASIQRPRIRLVYSQHTGSGGYFWRIVRPCADRMNDIYTPQHCINYQGHTRGLSPNCFPYQMQMSIKMLDCGSFFISKLRASQSRASRLVGFYQTWYIFADFSLRRSSFALGTQQTRITAENSRRNLETKSFVWPARLFHGNGGSVECRGGGGEL